MFLLAIIVIIVAVAILTYRAYTKLAHPFWSRMPVVHSFGLWKYVTPSGYIQDGKPSADQWWDPVRVNVVSFLDASEEYKREFCRFIRSHYLNSGDVKFLPPDDRLLPYFSADGSACYLSMISDKVSGLPGEKRTAGVISTRPLTLFLPDRSFVAHYCDLLCIHPDFRGHGLSPFLIQTQTYRARTDHSEIQACLFKRENNSEMCIVPLVEFEVFGFDCSDWTLVLNYKKRVDLVEIRSKNFFQIKEIFKEKVRGKFDYLIVPTTDKITGLVEAGVYRLFMLVVEDTIVSLYFFRDGSTTVKGSSVVECVASANISCADTDEFVFGFLKAYNELKSEFPLLSVDSISDNWQISDFLCAKYEPYLRTKSAFYLYNYSYPTADSKRCFVLD